MFQLTIIKINPIISIAYPKDDLCLKEFINNKIVKFNKKKTKKKR